jgi:hypothetical protein
MKGKGKVKLSLSFIKHHAVKTHAGVNVQLHHWWPQQYMEVNGQVPPATTGWEAWWAPEPIWALCGREKSCPCRGSNPDRPARSNTDWAMPTPRHVTKVKYRPFVASVLDGTNVIKIGLIMMETNIRKRRLPNYTYILCKEGMTESDACCSVTKTLCWYGNSVSRQDAVQHNIMNDNCGGPKLR